MAGLSAKRARFVEEYLIDFNGKQAAIRAGYSKRTAKAQGSRLLTFVDVVAAVDAGRKAQATRAHMSADEVINELALLARSNMQDYTDVNGDGDLVADLSSLTRDQAAAIGEVTTEIYVKDGERVKRVKFKLADKRAALVDLGKHLGLFTDKQLIKLEGNMSHDWTVKLIKPAERLSDA